MKYQIFSSFIHTGCVGIGILVGTINIFGSELWDSIQKKLTRIRVSVLGPLKFSGKFVIFNNNNFTILQNTTK